ncbi:FG-GAP-like repeat-containing protein [Streptomyces sp. NPDC008139]|uniref:FG-GAP-like repeat-containing protein n=1 Tax=Streptomyces sp. NPDC008139 TaxID=3364814 RepID=UPI0036E2A42C
MPINTRRRAPNHRRGKPVRMSRAALGAAMLAAGLVPLTVPVLAQADTAPSASRPTSGNAAAVAVAQAKSTGAPVDIPSLTTATESVTANPTGTLTVTESVYPTRVLRAGSWTPVDTTLHTAPDGSLHPGAVPSGISLSGGGTAPLAAMTSVGRRLDLSWPGSLPTPTVSGSTATYPDVLPGVDLQATVSPLGGLAEVLVVKNAAAAANPALSTLVLDTSAPGLTLSGEANGGVLVSDRDGAPVFSSPTASMWDSSTQSTVSGEAGAARSARTTPLADGPTADGTARSSATEPGVGAKTGTVTTHVEDGHLTLTPDSEVLRGADTHYPVYIDPDFNPMPGNDPKTAYDEIQQGCPSKNALNSSTAPYNTPGVGLNDFSGCIGVERALYQFKTDTHLLNTSARVISATFKAQEVYSASCSVTSNVNAFYFKGALSSSTTWDKRPLDITLQDTQSYGSACSSAPSKGFNVKDAFTRAHDGKLPSVGLMLSATSADEGSGLNFRRFASNPTVTVEYNTVPTVTSATTSPSASTIGHTTVFLNASVYDADAGAPLQAKFTLTGKDSSGKTVYPVAGSPAQPVELNTTVTQQGTISWRAGYLPTGTYTWTAQADDGDTAHPASVVTRTFKVDATAPGAPSITSPDIYPNPGDGTSPLTPPARTQLEFDITPPTGATDIAYYAYNWGTAPPTVNPPLTVKPDAGKQSATLHAVPMGFVRDQLFVYAVDKAGNESPANDFDFNTAPPTTPDATGDLTADGKPDLVAPGADGNLRVYPGTGNGGLATPVNLWSTAPDAPVADFTGAKTAVGAFRGMTEQDILVLSANGQANIYEGNGDGEPVPCSTSPDGCADLKQSAILSPGQDPGTGADIPAIQWSHVTQIAADNSQYAAQSMPGLWLVTDDGGLYWAAGTAAYGTFDTPRLINSGFLNTEIAYAGVVNGQASLWARNTSSGSLTLYTGASDSPAGADPNAKVVAASTGWGVGSISSIVSAGAANAGAASPNLWAIDAQAVHNISYFPAGSTPGKLGTRVHVQTMTPTDDFTGDGKADIIAGWNDGTLHLYTGQGSGKLTSGKQIWDSGWSIVRLMVAGDFTGDGRSDIIAAWDDGSLHRYDGTGTGGLEGNAKLFPGSNNWGIVREMTAGDFNGDGLTDLVAVWNDGTLHLYVNNGDGTLKPPVDFWGDNSWSGMRLLSGGDFNGDGNSDLLAIHTSDGVLRLYKGDGNGHLAAAVESGSLDWSNIRDIIPGDFSGDGKADLGAIAGDGSLRLYQGNGAGGFTNVGDMWPDTSWGTVRITT